MRTVAVSIWMGLVLCAAPASSHVALLEAEPADGAILASPPAVMVLRFGEPVAPISAQIVGAGIRLPVKMQGNQETVRLELPRELKPGPYVVSWRVGSLDEHPNAASLMFVIGPAGAKSPATGVVRALASEKDRVARVEISPGIAGHNAIVARLRLPKTPQEVAVELSNKEAGIEPLRRLMQRRDGAYVLDGPELLVPGTWKVTLDVLIDDFDKSFFDVDVAIR